VNEHTGSWLSTDHLPPLRRQFDMNRDPLIARQILDMEKTEAQRREDQRASEHAKPELKPNPHIRTSPAEQGWLSLQRNAMLAQAVSQNPYNDERSHTRTRHDYTR
jgi:hypothetical protein